MYSYEKRRIFIYDIKDSDTFIGKYDRAYNWEMSLTTVTKHLWKLIPIGFNPNKIVKYYFY